MEERRLRKAYGVFLGLLMVLAAAGCGQKRDKPASLRVFAAASLREPFTEIGRKYEAAHPGRTVEFQFAGSQALAAQIEQGAPADVFASADLAHMDALHTKRLVEPSVLFTHNRMVVITPAGQTRVKDPGGLAAPGVRVVLAADTVPAGRYARKTIAALNATGQYGADFQRRALANVVSHETNVRGVLAKVALGEADAGIVYVTDAMTERDKVRPVDIPADCNPRADYPAAVVSATRHKRAAADFIHFLTGAEGQDILARHGFQG